MKTRAYLWCVAAAWLARAAAGADGFEAPEIEAKTDWIAILVAILGVLGIAVAAFKSSRRTHLD